MIFEESRRQFIKNSGMSLIGLCLPGTISRNDLQKSNRYEGLKTKKYLGKIRVESRIVDSQTFTEGPAADGSGNVYFTNIPVEKILKWNPETKGLNTYLSPSHKANGLRFAMNGDLLICQSGTGKVIRHNLKTGEQTVLAATFQGKDIQAPNDLDFDLKGRIYFSSRTDSPDLEKQNGRAVYRIDSDGSLHQILVEPYVHMPNGVVISPDDKKLYLIEAHPDLNHHRSILVFDLGRDGSVSNQQTLIDFYPGRSGDGMCIDARGNLYVAAGLHKERGTSETLDTRPGIHVISPEGRLLAFRETPEDTITNCTFGGRDLKTLYVTCGSYLLSIRTKIPGKSSYLPSVP